MYPHTIHVNGIEYTCIEAAFQSFKLENREARRQFSRLNGFEAKKLGRRVQLRPDWNEIKVEVMYRLLKIKFKGELGEKLKGISSPIVEENTWGDTFWGVCRGRGQNQLGILLEQVRDEL
jgi:ribA/ribD-fused uncharacterized protein